MYQDPSNRPVNLDLRAFRFPLHAWLSILHRITGVFLVLSLLTYTALFNLITFHDQVSLVSVYDHPLVLLLHSVFWISLLYHTLSGTRHMLAEQFTSPDTYQTLNSHLSSYVLLFLWFIGILLAIGAIWL